MLKAIYNLPLKYVFAVIMLALVMSWLFVAVVLLHVGNQLCELLGLCTISSVIASVFVAETILKALIVLQYKRSVVPKLQAALKQCGLEQADIDCGVTAGQKGQCSLKHIEQVITAAQPAVDQESDLKVLIWNRDFKLGDGSELAQLADQATQLTRQLLN